jgi:hypothetical protein
MLQDYADELYNWADLTGQGKFKRRIYDALGLSGSLM